MLGRLFWGSMEELADESENDTVWESARVVDNLYGNGYRIGKVLSEEKEMQCGFDEGFKRGLEVSRIGGRFYGSLRLRTQDPKVLQQVEKLLLEIIPESGTGNGLQEHLDQLESIVASVPGARDNEFWGLFKHDLQRTFVN